MNLLIALILLALVLAFYVFIVGMTAIFLARNIHEILYSELDIEEFVIKAFKIGLFIYILLVLARPIMKETCKNDKETNS